MRPPSAWFRAAILALGPLASGGCVGVIEGADGTDPGSPGTPGSPTSSEATCANSDPQVFGPNALRRLTRWEYANTIRDLFGADVATAAGQSIVIDEPGAALGFGVLSHALGPKQIEDYFQAADTVSTLLTEQPAPLAALSPCLGQTPVTDACVRGFIDQVGGRVLRRPLTADESASYLAIYQEGLPLSAADGVRLVIFAMLQSVDFLYRPEIAGAAVGSPAGLYKLTGYEVATRLSYMLWGATPDDKLLDAAQNGALDTDAGVQSEVDRLLADPRARAWIQRFFEEWLQLEALPSFGQSDAFFAGINKTNLVADMRKELVDFTMANAFGGTFKDLMTSPVSFVSSADLAKVYGVAAAAGDGRITLPDTQRSGLLTRAGLLASAGKETSPVHRGVLIMRKLLCEAIPAPDPNSFPPNAIQPPAFSASKTGRERWTEKTGAAACAGCHGRINAFGFALENYDPVGRYREQETIYEPGTDNVASQLPIDAAVDLVWSGEASRVTSAADLGASLAENGAGCFGTQWFRFAFGREETADDACFIDELGGLAVTDSEGITGMFKRAATAPANRLRRVAP